MSAFRVLHLRRMFEHPGRSALSILGIAVGSMMVVSLLGLVGSITGSMDKIADLAGTADLEVAPSGDSGIDEAIATEVGAVRGVAVTAPVIRSSVVVGGKRALLLGADARATQLAGTSPLACEDGAAAATRPGALSGVFLVRPLAEDLGTEAGRQVRVYGGGNRHESVVVAGVIDCPAARVLNEGRVAAAVLPVAQRLAGKPGRVDAVFVEAADGIDVADLESRLVDEVGGRAVVSSPRQRVDQARRELDILQQGMSSAILVTLVVAGFLVYNAMSMAALERRRELATVRAVGGRRRPVLVAFLLEAGILGVVGSALGSVLGILLARAGTAATPAAVIDLVGVRPSFQLPAIAVPAAIVAGTLATLVAAYVPARAAVSVPPVDAMRPEGVLESESEVTGVRPVVLGIGLSLLLGGAAVSLGLGGNPSLAGFGLSAAGSIFTMFGLTGPITRAASRLASVFGPPGRLAAAALERAPRRTMTTTAAVAVAVGIVVVFGSMLENQLDTHTRAFSSIAKTDLWVQTSPSQSLPLDVQMPESVRETINGVPGVADVGAAQAMWAVVGRDRTLLEGVEPGSNAPLYQLVSARGRAAVDAGGAFIATRQFAHRQRLEVGDTLALRTPSGPRELRLAEVADMFAGASTGALVIRLEDLRSWYERPGAGWYQVDVEPNADVEQVRSDIRARLAGSPFPVHVETGKTSLESARRSIQQATTIYTVMQLVVVLAASLGIVNTLAISVAERRRELGIMRAVGTSRKQLGRMVVVEALSIAAVGIAIGVLSGLAQHRISIDVVSNVIKLKLDYALVPAAIITGASAAALMTLAGAVLPARRAGRVNIIEAIGYE